MRWFNLCAILLAATLLTGGLVAPTLVTSVPAADAPKDDLARDGIGFVQKHCIHCHGAQEPKADLSLQAYQDEASILKARKVWQNVLRMVQKGEMPPKERARPTAAEIETFVRTIKGVFERADGGKLDPGRVTLRRLNRVEYNSTIRDLVGVDFNPAEDFPADDVGHGFDNIGDVLTVSPVLLERYLAAAEGIVQRAIMVGPAPSPPKRRVEAKYLDATKENRAGVPLKIGRFRTLELKGDLHTNYSVTVEGEYRLRFRAWENHVGDEPVKVAVSIDGKEIETIEVKALSMDKAGNYESAYVALQPGEHKVAVAFFNEFTDLLAAKPEEAKRALFVQYFEFEGPRDTMPAAHRRIMACKPDQPPREKAREILTRFASAAYRRPVTKAEMDRLLELVDGATARGETFEACIQFAIQAILVSPKFLFRVELDDRPDSADPHAIDEYQLANRLSYFLWSSMPDEELFSLAARKQLTANLDAQVARMLKDPKAKALTDNFVLQWLQLQRLNSFAPDAALFPAFNEQLRSAMLQETRLFFGTIAAEDRSIIDLIDADFTFLNEPLARHYGIVDTQGTRSGQKPAKPGGRQIRGREFVRVSLPPGDRGGLLTQASVLTVTSNPTRTSPVKRGRWILEQLLGTPPPPPPPNVPELPDSGKNTAGLSLRQRLEAHRANAACANCHARMDPLGFALENFDAIGAFRAKDGDVPIDPSGTLPDGKTFSGPSELKAILKERKEQFCRCLVEKMLIYGLGRGIEYYDKAAVDKITAALARNDYRFSVLVAEIVKSDPFRLRRGRENK